MLPEETLPPSHTDATLGALCGAKWVQTTDIETEYWPFGLAASDRVKRHLLSPGDCTISRQWILN